MIFLYIFCTFIMIFKIHPALKEQLIQFDQEQYDQFKNNCKFFISQTIFDIDHQGKLMPTSNKECLKELITSIDNYLELINSYQISYQNETEHSSRYTISENKLKEITNAIYESKSKIKIAIIKTRSLFNGFEDIEPNIFDPLECSFKDLKKCFQTEHVTSFKEIKQRSHNLLITITWIESQTQLSNNRLILNHHIYENNNNFQPHHNSKIQKKTIFTIFLITVFLMYCSRLFIIHSNSN